MNNKTRNEKKNNKNTKSTYPEYPVYAKRIMRWSAIFDDILANVKSAPAYIDPHGSYLNYKTYEKADGRSFKDIVLANLDKKINAEDSMYDDQDMSVRSVLNLDKDVVRAAIDALLDCHGDKKIGTKVVEKFYRRGDMWYHDAIDRAVKYAITHM